MTITFIIIAVVAVIVVFVISAYNNLVKLRNNRENAFADIDVQLKQRFDLVPQLVATVKGYAAHEKDLLENITAARTAGVNASSIDDKIKADQQLTSALAGLRIQVEAYPDLKANQNFMQLQTELADIENKLASVRRFFNSATKELNNGIQTFPANVLAGMFGFTTQPMFEVAPEERAAVSKAPKVEF
jgi:LemA protein